MPKTFADNPLYDDAVAIGESPIAEPALKRDLLEIWWHVALILLVASLLSFPCLRFGLPEGYSAAAQIDYQHHFSRQFWTGDYYPRWLSNANKGYGSPIMIIQYPLPYFVGALLSHFSNADESRTLGVLAFMMLAGAGLGALFWLRKFTGSAAAVIGALIYMALPYVIGPGLYGRTSLGELCAFDWMPLAFGLCESMHTKLRAVLPLSLAFALLIVSNIINAALFAPPLIAYAMFSGMRLKISPYRSGALAIFAEGLGGGLAAIYILPVLAYSRFFKLEQLAAHVPSYKLGLYFLYLSSEGMATRVIPLAIAWAVLFTMAAAGTLFFTKGRSKISIAVVLALGTLTLIPDLGSAVIRISGLVQPSSSFQGFAAKLFLSLLITIDLGIIAYCRIPAVRIGPRDRILLLMAGAAFFFMLPFSAPIWKAIPPMSTIQFPFRLAGIVNIAVIGLLGAAFDSCLRDRKVALDSRVLVLSLATVATIVCGIWTWSLWGPFVRPSVSRFQPASNVDGMYRTYVAAARISPFEEMLHADGNGVISAQVIAGNCIASTASRGPRELAISADCKSPARLRISQLFFPLWKVVPSAGSVSQPTVEASPQGLIELTLSPGKQDFRLIFDMGGPERWGAYATVTLFLLAILAYIFLWVIDFNRAPADSFHE